MITRADVADLQPGDVVEIADDRWPGVTIRGPLHVDRLDGVLSIGEYAAIRFEDGDPGPVSREFRSLTVVSRAPRPLYVNHPRTEPVPGDVVRDADSTDPRVWSASANGWWGPLGADDPYEMYRTGLPARLRLLVDGETGRGAP